jgi:hypothetical protein
MKGVVHFELIILVISITSSMVGKVEISTWLWMINAPAPISARLPRGSFLDLVQTIRCWHAGEYCLGMYSVW